MKKLFVYIVVMTAVLANMDWKPIHYSWWHDGTYPAYAGTWERWSNIRKWTAIILCPPCAPLAENYYYVLLDVESGTEEQKDLMPMGHNHNPLNPHGDWMFRWGQADGTWRRVSMLTFYLWWLPYTVVWFVLVRRFFR